MSYLIDTHSLIWFLKGDSKLSKKAISLIEDQNNEKFISVASLWELAVKSSLEKFHFDQGFSAFVDLVQQNEFKILSIQVDHLVQVSNLRFIHRDPFDRLIIAQSQIEKFPVVTKDRYIQSYNIDCIW